MVRLGEAAPDFSLPGVLHGVVREYSLKEFRGKWVILFFYPKDFTFICPTEVSGFNQKHQDFERANAQILGVSIDSVEVHSAWAKELGGLSYPLISDENGIVAKLYDAFDVNEGVPRRATFIIDPEQRLSYIVVSHVNVGRSIEETYRVLEALRTGRPCPSGWQPGEPTLDPSMRY